MSPRLLGPHAWRGVVDAVVEERLVGLLGAAVDGGLAVSDEQAAEVAALRREAAVRAARLDTAVVAVHDALDVAGVDHRILKGQATARVLYPSPTWRDAGDVDLWVRPAALDATVAALTPLGFALRPAVLGSVPDAALLGRVTFDGPDGVEADVHVALRYWSAAVPNAAFDHSQAIVIGARTMQALDREGMAVHAAAHLVVGHRWSTVADLLRLLTPDLALRERFGDELSPATAAAVVAAVERCRRVVPVAPLADEAWLRAQAARPQARIAAGVQALPGLRAELWPLVHGDVTTSVRALRQLVLPSRALLAQRGMTLPGHYRRLAGRIAHLDQPGQPYPPPEA